MQFSHHIRVSVAASLSAKCLNLYWPPFVNSRSWTLKVCPHYAAWHTAARLRAKFAPCCKYMWMLRWLICGMKAVWHMMSKRFQNGISQFEKKIRPSSPILFHSFCNLKKVCKKFFFHVDEIALAAYAEQLLPRGKAAVCYILLRGIVWTHLNKSFTASLTK